MALSRTTNGLVLLDEIESTNDWAFHNGGHGVGGVDNSSYVSGSGSLYTYNMSRIGGSVSWFERTLDFGSATGRKIHLWTKSVSNGGSALGYALAIGSTTIFGNYWSPWHHCYADLNDSITGSQSVKVARSEWWSSDLGATVWTDHLVVSLGNNVAITGLVAGQKVELYRTSDSGLIASATCASGQTSVSISVADELFPESASFKIYLPDGTTLVETILGQTICGGDSWAWSWSGPLYQATLKASSNYTVIYRAGSQGSPTSATITATLTKTVGGGYASQSLSFSTSFGTLSDSTKTTDSNGQASVTLTATADGIATILISWAGGSPVAGASFYVPLHVFFDLEDADSAVGFQVYVQGRLYHHSGGNYRITNSIVNQFSIVIPEYLTTIIRLGIVHIYRFGVLEFAGILKDIGRALSGPQVSLTGGDVLCLLADRAIDLYSCTSQSANAIFIDLLELYICGLKAGLVNPSPITLSAVYDTIGLPDAIQQLRDSTGWPIRANPDLTLDLAPSFSLGNSTVVFVEGEGGNILDGRNSRTIVGLANSVHVRGATLRGGAFDLESIRQLGLHEWPSVQPQLVDQGSVSQAAVGLLASTQKTLPQVSIDVIDMNPTGVVRVGQNVSVTSPRLRLAGMYPVVSLERDLSKAHYAKLYLENLPLEVRQLAAPVRRMASALATDTQIVGS